ncbi:hypothetical protein I4U23_011787 [Adineta vaga]|nr:hypothetical protein I4U23_011787 [Adineta vaga]
MGSGASISKIEDDFFNICSSGDIKNARRLLLTMTYKKFNRQRRNGNTPLHMACLNDHKDIIILLLNEEDVCARTLRNKDGKTAYDCVKSPEIRQLFRRSRESTVDRFSEKNPTSSLQPILSPNDDEIKISHEQIPDDWVRGYTNAKQNFDGQFMLALQNAPLLLRALMKTRTINEAEDTFEIFLEKCIEHQPNKRYLIREEYKRYRQTKNVEHLLTIYTFETIVYKALQQEMNAYTTLLFLNLKKLVKRSYQGRTYRGAQMTQIDIDAYTWAQKSKDFLLETRLFQSTSKTKNVAEVFGEANPRSDKYGVVFAYIFDEQCPTAIDLQGISYFEEEDEVLLFPFTLFKVDNIIFVEALRHYDISLRYIPSSKKSFLSSWWNAKE